MKPLQEFLIPILGLKHQDYQFDYQIDKSFFAHFEDSLIEDGNFKVKVNLEKKDTMLVFLFSFEGKVVTDCDRCAATINLPLADTQKLIVKYSEEEKEGDDELVYIHPDASSMNIAQYIYEYICVNMPLYKMYDCENDTPRPCDLKSLAQLEKHGISEAEAFAEKGNRDSSIWDTLKESIKSE